MWPRVKRRVEIHSYLLKKFRFLRNGERIFTKTTYIFNMIKDQCNFKNAERKQHKDDSTIYVCHQLENPIFVHIFYAIWWTRIKIQTYSNALAWMSTASERVSRIFRFWHLMEFRWDWFCLTSSSIKEVIKKSKWFQMLSM